MAPYHEDTFGNPSSLHQWGREARVGLDGARKRVAGVLGVKTAQVFFVRGGTEADNLAVLGCFRRSRATTGSMRVITSSVEHPAVYESAQQVANEGGQHIVIPTDSGRPLDLTAFAEASKSGAAVASVIWVNNEVGLELPIGDVAAICREHGIPLHSDAVQAVGKVPVDVTATGLDLMTVTGHKIGGPKGTGMLYVENPEMVAPLLHGGGQEGRLRPGTEDVAGAVGFARALEIAVDEQPKESTRLAELRDDLEARVTHVLPSVQVHGRDQPRAPHVSSLEVPDVDGEMLLASLDMAGLAVSGGSACASGSGKPSRILTALYGERQNAVVRISLGHLSSGEDMPVVADSLVGAILRLSPTPTRSS